MEVDNNVCLHCGACVGICPPNALFLHETETIEFLDNCTDCGLCVWVCPVGAIDFGESPVKLPLKRAPVGGNGRFLVGVDGGKGNGNGLATASQAVSPSGRNGHGKKESP